MDFNEYFLPVQGQFSVEQRDAFFRKIQDADTEGNLASYDGVLGQIEDVNRSVDAKLSEKAGKNVATQSANGLMSSSDKIKLDGIAAGATANSPYTSNPMMDGTASPGSASNYARGNHVHPTDTSRAPTNHASTATTFGAGDASNYGHLKLSASTASTLGTSGGTAATPSAVKAAYDWASLDHRNLLDNWYFVGGGSQQGGGQFPINQRGYSGASAYSNRGFSIDRWYIPFDVITVGVLSDGITLSPRTGNIKGELLQFPNIAALKGKTATISALVSVNGAVSLLSATGSVPASNPAGSSEIIYTGEEIEINFGYWTGAPGGARWYFSVRNKSTSSPVKILAVKLELGDQQTLAHQDAGGNWVLNDPPPDYATELVKCQRYLTVLGGASDYDFIGFANGSTAKAAVAIISLPTTMRKAVSPTFSASGGWTLVDRASGAANRIVIDSFNTFRQSQNGFSVICNLSNSNTQNLTAGKLYEVSSNNDPTAKMTISAET